MLQATLHATHLHKLLDKMCKYEMDPTKSAVQTDGRTEWNQYTPNNFFVRRV